MFVIDMLCKYLNGCHKGGVLCMSAIKKIAVRALCVILDSWIMCDMYIALGCMICFKAHVLALF